MQSKKIAPKSRTTSPSIEATSSTCTCPKLYINKQFGYIRTHYPSCPRIKEIEKQMEKEYQQMHERTAYLQMIGSPCKNGECDWNENQSPLPWEKSRLSQTLLQTALPIRLHQWKHQQEHPTPTRRNHVSTPTTPKTVWRNHRGHLKWASSPNDTTKSSPQQSKRPTSERTFHSKRFYAESSKTTIPDFWKKSS